jgi:hypothetical protein
LENIDIVDDLVTDATLKVPVTQIRYGIKIGTSSVMMNQVRIVSPQRGCLYISGGAVDIRATTFRCLSPSDLSTSGTAATYGHGINIDDVDGTTSGTINFDGLQVYRPRLRGINGAGDDGLAVGTYDFTMTNSMITDSGYDNNPGFQGILPTTSGKAFIVGNQFIDTSATSLMGPFVELSAATGINVVVGNSFPGTVSGGNPKLATPSDTTFLASNYQTDFVFAGLPAEAADGSSLYCSNCSPTLTGCQSGGTGGAIATRLANAWTCGPVSDSAYGGGWDGSFLAPTQNAVFDKLNAMLTGAASVALTCTNSQFVRTLSSNSSGAVTAATCGSATSAATVTLTCGAGEAVKNLTVVDGIVTAASCGTP